MMAEVTSTDLLTKIDEQAVLIGRLQLTNGVLERENKALKQALVPLKPNRAERRRKKKAKE